MSAWQAGDPGSASAIIAMRPQVALPRNTAVLRWALAAATALACAGLLAAAFVAPAPVVALPLVIIAGIGAPMLATWEASAGARRRGAGDGASARRLMADMRRFLAQLPETRHPFDG
jgi:hypothetical protein